MKATVVTDFQISISVPLMSGVIFTCNRKECFREIRHNENTFSLKTFKKKNVEPHKNFTGFYKKRCKDAERTSNCMEYQCK